MGPLHNVQIFPCGFIPHKIIFVILVPKTLCVYGDNLWRSNITYVPTWTTTWDTQYNNMCLQKRILRLKLSK